MAGPSATTNDKVSQVHTLTLFVLLWLAGTALRLTILAVPPVIPLIHDDLQLTATQIGILTGLPSMMLALAAVPGSLLIARLGVRNALVFGLLVNAGGSALRGVLPDVQWLYAMTIVTGAGVAIMQVALPSTVREWTPTRIPFATALYTNGLLIGELLPVGLTLPFVLPLTGSSWERGFVFWSIPVAALAGLVLVLAPRSPKDAAIMTNRRRWWPDWRNHLIWRLGFMLGTVNAVYFATNAFIPDYLRNTGQSDWISAALSALNAGQLPASLLLLGLANRLERKAWPYVICGFIEILATSGIVFGNGPWIVTAAALQGFAAASILILVLALPPLLSPPNDVHRVTAAMFTISYSCAVIIPIISGMAWDWSGIAAFAFLPIGICGLVLIILAPAINDLPSIGS
jgi:MFS transporter, CP family, cyanate transporter